MSRGISVGIDLGTTNSLVSVPFGEQVQIVNNSRGDVRTPSVVNFMADGAYVGEDAVDRAVNAPLDTVFSIKRQIGNDEYEFAAPDGCRYSPVEISGTILKKLKEDTEERLSAEVTNAVITVPAYFGNEEREATKTAGEVAGLEIDRVINEPTAAALAYGYRSGDEELLLVYDLGGGTFDVSLVEVSEGIIEVRATDGDSLLGGEDWDGRILDRLLELIATETGTDPESDNALLQRLWDTAQKTKHELSKAERTTVELPFLTEYGFESPTPSLVLTRDEFEQSTADLLDRTLNITHQVLKDAGHSRAEIDDILLVGGSTRMPQVQTELEEMFGWPPNGRLDPDMAVAIGAGKQAHALSPKGIDAPDEPTEVDGLTRTEDGITQNVILVDVVSQTLGTEAIIDGRGGRFSPLIRRNTVIPDREERTYYTAHDGQEQVTVGVYQGESELASENEFLGDFELRGIRPAPAGEMSIRVTFEMNENGILNVSARNPESGRDNNLTIESGIGISERERAQMRRSLPNIL